MPIIDTALDMKLMFKQAEHVWIRPTIWPYDKEEAVLKPGRVFGARGRRFVKVV